MTSVQPSLRDPEADGTSLKWEDFFGQTNSDDLLPCLLGVYDSIAGKGFRKDVAVSSDDGHMAIVQNQRRQSRNLETLAKEVKRQYTSAVDEAPKKQLTRSESLKHERQRPSSLASEVSSSSLSSAVSIEISSCCSSGSDLSDAIRHHQCHFVNKPTSCYLASEESLAEELHHHQEEAKKKHCSNRLHIPRVTTTTSSQYSEDSGVFSSLQRSESVKGERSYSYETNLDYTTKVILEIIETETVYVNDLRQIIEGYLDEWRNNPNCYLTDEQINDLFSNIEEIYDFSRCFLWELEQCGVNPVNIARCFVQNNSNFSIYATYCTNYPRSVSVLTELMRQEKTACIFRDRQMSLQHTLPLGSYLLKPVQRILKYHLLLQNMVKHSSSDSVGYNDVTVALSTMTGIAHHINNMKRKHEHAVRVQEVQSLLIGWQGPDLVVFGELYAEGTFRISGARALRHIFLFEHMLLVTKKKEGGVLHYKTHIICSNLMLVECLPKEPLSFQIIPFDNPRLQLTVHARSLEEKRHWALELKRVILENYNVEIPSHARQLVMELGQVQHLADNLSLNKILHRRQHSTPEYLEKRRTTRKNRKKTLRSHLAPLIRKSDLLGHKIQNKFRKSQSNEDSLLSSTSVNSLDGVDSDSQDKVLFNSAATNERGDGDRNDEFNVSPKVIRSMSYSFTNGDNTDDINYISKEKAIEEIIGQLIMENKKFQQAIKSEENDLSSFNNHSSGDDVAYENRLRNILKQIRDDQSSDSAKSLQNDSLDYIEDDYDTSLSSSCKLESCCSSSSAASNSVAENTLSSSLNTLIPTSPIVWLKQQDQHLAAPSKKADSLPRTFQISTDDSWKTNRPKTIASDKPQQMKDFAIEDGTTECSNSCLMLATTAANDHGKSLTGSSSDTTPHHSLHNLNVHPECKFYRTSVTTRLTLMKMMNNLSAKISSLKLQLDEHQYHQPNGTSNDNGNNCYSNNNSRSNVSSSDTHRDAKSTYYCDQTDNNNLSALLLSATGYRQGSSKLGARIAKCTELSDYADPRVLFSTITPSRKAASILGIRPFCAQSTPTMNGGATIDDKPADVRQLSEHCCADSDCSADSFYEHKFEEVEKLFLNSDNSLESRRNSLLFDFDDPPTDRTTIKFSSRSYAHLLTPNITVHKPIRIPPPVPIKPKTVKLIPNTKRFTVVELKKQINDGNQVTVLESSSLPTRGWVKQVVNKIQAAGVVE